MDDDDDGEEQENIDVSDSRLVGSQYFAVSCRRWVAKRIYPSTMSEILI